MNPNPNTDTHTSGAAKPRHDWIDAVRGFAVFMVVLMHLGIYHFLPMAEGTPAAGAWAHISDLLQYVRMPALLVLSGWLLNSRVREGLWSRRTLASIGANAYLYVLWLAIYAAIMSTRDTTDFAHALGWDTFWDHLLKPQSTLWFLVALACYTVVMAGLRRVPAAVTVSAMGAVSWVGTSLWPPSLGLWANIPQYAVFFALGVHVGPLLAVINSHTWRVLLGAAVVATAAGVAVDALGTGFQTYPLVLALSLSLVAVLFAVAALLARHAGIALRPAVWVGRRTLPVYVLHYPLLVALATTSNEWLRELDEAFIMSGANWAYPVVVTAVVVALSVIAKETADRVGLGWLFRMPPMGALVPAVSRRPAPRDRGGTSSRRRTSGQRRTR